jgi:hypothetical protein
MVTNDKSSLQPQADSQCRKNKPGHSPGFRWLSVLLPQKTFNHLHIQARLSNRSFRSYMEEFCLEAFPLNDPIEANDVVPEQAKDVFPK